MQETMQTGTCSFVLQGNLIIIDVRINGVDAEFILDTGAGGTVLSKTFADRLGLKEADRGAGGGAGGVVTMSLVAVDTITAAGITDRNVQCAAIDISSIRGQVGENIEGVLGYDFFGAGSLHIDYPARRVKFERPPQVQSAGGAVIESETVRLPRFGVEMTMPSAEWVATSDTPLPLMPVIVNGPDGAKITASETVVQGLSASSMRASIDASVEMQVEDFERADSRDVMRAGRPAYRVEYVGTDEGVRKRLVSEALHFDGGLLVLTCEAPVDSFAGVSSALEAVLSSLQAAV